MKTSGADPTAELVKSPVQTDVWIQKGAPSGREETADHKRSDSASGEKCRQQLWWFHSRFSKKNKIKNKKTLQEFLVRLKTETANLQAFRTPCVGILKQSYASALLSLQIVKIQQVSPWTVKMCPWSAEWWDSALKPVVGWEVCVERGAALEQTDRRMTAAWIQHVTMLKVWPNLSRKRLEDGIVQKWIRIRAMQEQQPEFLTPNL